MAIKTEAIIELSETQAEILKPLFKQVHEACGENQQGMVIAQAWENENGKVYIAAAFLQNRVAIKVLDVVESSSLEFESKVEEFISEIERDLEKLKKIINAVPH